MSEPQPLHRIGDYEVLSTLGAGGMGKVFKVRNTLTDRIEALKIVLPDLAGKKEVADRFLREIKVLASLNHPNIAALHTALTVDNQLVMVMEYVEGSPLSERLEKGPIPPAQAVDYIEQTLAALSYAHAQHVIHRDIKPGNMMLTPQGLVKLMDFGIARSSAEPGLTATGASLGSLPYMSPEQIMGSAVDARADLYSVGVSLYEMVTGRRPFEAGSSYSVMAAHLQKTPTPPIELHPGLPAMLNQIILMAMAKDPAGRFQSADAFCNALKSVAATLPDASGRAVSAAPAPGAAVVLQDSPTLTSVAAVPAQPVAQPPAQPAGAAVAAVGRAAQPGASSAAGPPSGPTPPAAAAGSSGSDVAMANPSRSAPMPVTAKQGGYRGLYMTLGALVVVAVLVAAGLYLPRWARARAGGAAGSNAQSGSQPPASGTSAGAANGTSPAATQASPVPAAASDAASAEGGQPTSQPPAPNPPSTPAAGSSSAPATSGAPPSRSAKRASQAGNQNQQAAPENPPQAQPSAPQPADSQSPPPQAAGSESSQPEAAGQAELQDLESQMDQLAARARAVKDGVDNFRQQQAKQGFNLRGDISAAEDRMATNMDKAQAALQNQNAKDARRYMEKAEADVETLEKFLGRR